MSAPERESTNKDDPDEDEDDGKCTISPETMKLVTLFALLVSDFDIVFTLVAMYIYVITGGLYIYFACVIIFFFLGYCAACIYAALESKKFVQRFQDKVKVNEISGISLEDLDDAMNGRRIFWMGPIYEKGKRQKGVIDALKALTPEAVDPNEIDIGLLERGLKDAAAVKADTLKMPGDTNFGARMVMQADWKLKAAKKAQRGEGGEVGSDPPEVEVKEDLSFEAKMFLAELQEAESQDDDNKATMITLAMLDQLDSYRMQPKMLNASGKVDDQTRGLYMVCEAKGILSSYYRVSRSFARRIVKPEHSIPYFRLMIYGWQPTVNHFDFAGILNANAVYSFTVGLPQLVFSLAFMASDRESSRTAAPCETENQACSMAEDFGRPHVQAAVLAGAVLINVISIAISVSNIIIDFPAQIFKIVEKEEEAMYMQLQAEAATTTWEEKLAKELDGKVKNMLKVSTLFEANTVPGMEAPRLVIDDVIKLERQAMKKKIRYLEYFLDKQEKNAKKVKSARRKAAREAKKEKEEAEVARRAAQESAAP